MLLQQSGHGPPGLFRRAGDMSCFVKCSRISFAVFLCGVFVSRADAAKKMESPDLLRPWMRELLNIPASKLVRPGVLRFEKSYERTNKETGEHLHLRYTTEREENAFINLDLEPGLSSVNCEKDTLILEVENSFSVSEYVINNIGRLVYGGSEWGCQTKSKENGPIFKSISSMAEIHNDSNSTLATISFETNDASPFSFFGR
jgi:hypothetical protein